MNNLKIPFSAPLNEQDTESQTYGCRQTNPYVCTRNGIPGVCAFASEDHICRKPSRLWRDQYIKLSKENDEDEEGLDIECQEKARGRRRLLIREKLLMKGCPGKE